LRRRRKGGAERNALGRSRGGYSTKINARTNAEGLPIGIVITPGQAHDVTAVPALMHDIDCDPEQMLGDKGYDSEAVRQDIEQRGGQAMILVRGADARPVTLITRGYGATGIVPSDVELEGAALLALSR
jgi:IS5 family transposase